jgi:hypothetical protein
VQRALAGAHGWQRLVLHGRRIQVVQVAKGGFGATAGIGFGVSTFAHDPPAKR